MSEDGKDEKSGEERENAGIVSPPPATEDVPVPPEPVAQTPTEDASGDEDGDQSLDAQLKKQVGNRRPKISLDIIKRNEKQLKFGMGGLFVLLIVLMVYSCEPRKGSMAFGVCSAFLELNTPYPHTLRYTDVEGSRTAVRIYFTDVDPFGEFKQEMMECTFGPDEKMGMKMTRVTRNRRPVDQAAVDEFNIAIPAIMSSDPYLVLPPNWKNPLVREYYQNYQE